MKILKGLLPLAVWLLMSQSYGADAIALLKAFSKNTVSASGEFLQSSIDEKGQSSAEKSTGRFAFARPGKFLWETQSPFPQRIVSDAKTLWIYDPDLKQVTVRTLKREAAGSPAALLFGQTDLQAAFHLKELPSKDALSWVSARPKKADATYVALEIGMDEKGLPREMRVLDTFGMTNVYTFTRFKVPSEEKDTIYDFQIPPGADVLRDSTSE